MIQTYINLSDILYWRSKFQLSNPARLTQLPKRTEEEILTCCGRLWDDVPQPYRGTAHNLYSKRLFKRHNHLIYSKADGK